MSFSTTMKKLFETKDDSDVTFILNNTEIEAHQFVLIHRSPFFKAMIKGPMAPANQRHEITDPKITAEHFMTFLEYLYIDHCEITVENIEALLHMSHMYDVPSLFEICVDKIPTFFCQTSLFKFAELGLFYNNQYKMTTKCLCAVPEKAQLLPLKYFNDKNDSVWVSSELVIEFIKQCPRTNSFTEDNVFEKVFEWAKGQCDLEGLLINAENLNIIMAQFEPYLNYEKMKTETLTTTVYQYKLISDEKLLKCFRDLLIEKENYLKTLKSGAFIVDFLKPQH